MLSPDFLRTLEQQTGESIESLRNMPIDERRRMNEAKHGKPMQILSHFPLIGRAFYSTLVSHEQVEAELDEALR